jgi:cytochrome c peroxidase
MRKSLVIIGLVAIIASAYTSSNKISFSIPQKWPKPEYNFKSNPLTVDKVLLGRVLFYDPLLSRDNSISCASCHNQYTAFAHVDHDLSHGIEDRIGKRNAPALMNLAWQKSFMWDGAVNHLDMQALAPLSNHDEMDESVEHVVTKLQQKAVYPTLFNKAFGDSTITGQHLLQAISQFMLTLVSSNSKYDQVIRNEAKFTEQEKNGYRLFQQNCSSCHKEPLFTSGAFANNGLKPDTTLHDVGRVAVTTDPDDSFKYKIPTLRNIEFSYPYMHDGRFKKLSDVMNHYTRGITRGKTLAPQLQKPMQLTANEKVDIVAFLLTLTDKEFLFNPAYSFPKNILLATKN